MRPTDLAAAAGISMSYASMILSGARPPARPLAITIFQRTGRKFGPIADLSDDDIATLARIEGIEPATRRTPTEAQEAA